ncbi:hypothetical protein [Lentzea flava]|uniref:Pre-peptidase C-terminal domain-containing protein n=1 Tax=Lentzea flava TaxID=103732 RepID=A0ABQ2UG30_9PSEU|nr:hypothetical protein [Lentzea flava]MCP2198584.1 hypothetical protein [Lentzea flava]GGU26878.1 hypothetical protein GCM10010178_19150 [Lentzea flava]
MRKHLFGVLAAGVALSLVAAGQSAAEPVAQQLSQPEPMLAFLPAEAQVDWAAVQRNRESRKRSRAAARTAGTPLAYTEKETAQGANDTPAKAEHVAGFGTGRGKNPKLTLTGDLAGDPTIPAVAPFAETNDAIPLGSDTGVPARGRALRTNGTIGDGPHGSGGDGTGDHDFYRLSGGANGTVATVETHTPTGDLDTLLAAYSADGQLIAQNDNLAGVTDSRLQIPVPAGTDVFVMVASSGPGGIPADPMKPGTGKRVLTEGPYDLTIATGDGQVDRDFFAVDLKAGDVLGASAAGRATRVMIHDPAGREVFGSSQDASFLYAENSPMPAGGNAVADFVAPKDGRYTVGVENGEGRYDVTVEAYRPGSELNPRPEVLTVFLDFNGARVNTRIYGAEPAGNRDLSPLRKFLPGWGLTDADENAVIDAVIASVRENIEHDLAHKGTNRRFSVRILNSRDHADPWGQPNVSRVVVGGSIAESGIPTVGIAQSIDAGNFGKEETALVLLDVLSLPAGQSRTSLNTYITPATTNKQAFIGRAIGNIVAHEAGHMSGSWHQDQFNAVDSLMDQGGNPKGMFGVGPDGVGGTADDIDVDFQEDVLNPNEGFTGIEDSLNRTAWAYTRGSN